MEIDKIKTLLTAIDQSTLQHLAYEDKAVRLVLSKRRHELSEGSAAPTSEIGAQVITTDSVMEAAEVTSQAIESSSGEWVTSPIVGVAYLSPSPEQAPFVKVGDQVTKGQPLLIIEAMKVMNEVPSPKDGVVTAINVDNEQMVEYGQDLIQID